MQRPDRLLSLIVDLNQVFILRNVLKDLFTVHDDADRVSAMKIALCTAWNRVVCFTSSIIPRELSSSGSCFCTSYHARASSTRVAIPYISLTDETMCLNSSRENVKIWRVTFTKATSRTGHRWCDDSTPQWTLLHSASGPGLRISEA
ncbi:hypothetical protein LSH36_219g04019 [Paralvinella palmiformis]|uniref:Uncharacterized protein n=1 Tax=Paralvinella palmiformis TaxID=53620 RepID=A0AAD9JMZ3_9ANNE|nr:hypothetical protein LSH36_219g04019 [Paralvinella palmiformis]